MFWFLYSWLLVLVGISISWTKTKQLSSRLETSHLALLVQHEIIFYPCRYMPESCVLIVIGILIGVISYYATGKDVSLFPKFTAELFFNCLLPPIILGEWNFMNRADMKSQMGFCTTDFLFSLAYESAEQKPKHCLTWGFPSGLFMNYIRHGAYQMPLQQIKSPCS